MSRTGNSLRNILSGVGNQCATMGIQFISKTIFIYTLGAEYLGVQSLFTNFVSLLNISELGIGTAIVFSLYRVLADHDEAKIAATMRLMKRAYAGIGAFIFFLSLVCYPFLPYILNGVDHVEHISLIYVLYVADTLLTYWFYSYKTAILQADQKQYVLNLVNLFVTFLRSLAQILVLFFTSSFLGFLALGIVSKILMNLYLSHRVDQIYPFLRTAEKLYLSKDELHSLFVNVRAIAIYNGGYQLNRVLDTFLISIYIDTVTVGIYGNYLLLINACNSLLNIVFSSFSASLGNLVLQESRSHSYFIFRCLNQMNFWMGGVVALCIYGSINAFIHFWIGDEYIFDSGVTAMLVLNFYLGTLGNAIMQFRNAYGLFDQGKYRPLASCIVNGVLSILLAPSYGILGILGATIASRYLTFWWFDAWLVYHYGFQQTPWKYYFGYVRELVVFVIIAAFTYYGMQFFSVLTPAHLVFLIVLIFLSSNGLMWLRYHSTDEYQCIHDRIRSMLLPKLHRLLP